MEQVLLEQIIALRAQLHACAEVSGREVVTKHTLLTFLREHTSLELYELAGGFYAAGFLSGLCDGLSLRQCGTIGAITAGKVIEVVGTTFGEEAWEDISRLVNKVKNEKYLF